MMFSEKLSPADTKIVLCKLGIDWKNKQPDKKGWINIKSPLREENNPSFGLNIKTGAFKDHGTDQSGDIVKLIEHLNNFDNSKAIHWIKEQVGFHLNNSINSSSKSSDPGKVQDSFWTSLNKRKLKKSQKRLENESNHPLLEKTEAYDQLDSKTLQFFGCGVLKQYGQDWLAFPYETGCQLYRRENDDKKIRSLKGSTPANSFFGVGKLSEGKSALLIAKSPREAMLLHQAYSSGANVLGLATGEQGNLSPMQQEWLTNEISGSSYAKIMLFLDCDTDEAYQMAKNLARNIKEIASSQEVSILNIHQMTNGVHKDIADLARNNINKQSLTELYENRELISATNKSKKVEDSLKVTPDDLKLSEKLIEQFPDVIQKYIKYASPLSDVPDEFLLTPFIAIAGAAIGKKRYIKLGGLQFYPTIWTVLFAGSTTLRKSTAISMAKTPFKPTMEQYQLEYERDLKLWEEEKQYREENDEVFDVNEQKKQTLYCPDGFSDLTFWESLRDNGSIISTPTEFTALWDELNKPRNSLGDLVLSLFDAEDSIRRTTKNAGDIELNNPVWCIAGATTPSNFRQALTSTERGSGLLQRILPVFVGERTKEFKAPTELPNHDPNLYSDITEITQQLKELNSCAVEISETAKQQYTRWCHKMNDRAEALTERLPDVGGFISRLSIYGIKFSLIFQQLEYPGGSISAGNMRASIALCEWLYNHIIYMMNRNYIFDNDYADRLTIRERIESQDNERITRTKLMNLSNFNKARLDKAIESEMDAGKIEEIKIDTAGRPRFEYKRIRDT